MRAEGYVNEYRATELFAVLRRALQNNPSIAKSREALQWTYRFVRSREDPPWTEIATVDFQVPTADGEWIPARTALFSKSWGAPADELLSALINRAADVSEDLGRLRRRLLAAPEEWPFRINDQEQFRQFLERLRVSTGLVPETVQRSEAADDGRFFEDLTVAKRVPLSPAAKELWIRSLQSRAPRYLRPYTRYRGEALSRLPGQDDYEAFDESCRRMYAQLIVIGLENWDDKALSISVRRYNDSSDSFTWPTPAYAFLEHCAWLPMAKAGERNVWQFERPATVWTHGGRDEAPPTFAPLVPSPIRRLAEARPAAQSRLRQLGVRYWDSPDTAADRLRLLPKLFAEGAVSDTAAASFKKAYADAWEELVQHGGRSPFGNDPGDSLLVTRRGRLEVMPLSGGDNKEPVYVQDVETNQALRLLEQQGAAMIRLRHDVGAQVSDLIAGHLGARVRRVSGTEVAVLVDGVPFTPADQGDHLVGDDRQWFGDLIVALVETRSGQFRRIGAEALRRTVETLDRTRLNFAERVETLVDGTPVASQDRPLALADAEHPTVVTRRPDGGPFATLQLISQAVAELIGYPGLADSIRLSLIDLERQNPPGEAEPTLSMIAEAVGEPEHRLRET